MKNDLEIKEADHLKNISAEIIVDPWRRIFARFIDINILALICGLVIGMLQIQTNKFILGFIPIYLLLITEPMLLSTIGTTPGKWLLKVKLVRNDGKKLKFIEAFKRTLSVIVKGMGLGIPFINLIFCVRTCVKLEKEKVTIWDKTGNFIVTDQNMRTIRKIIAGLILIIFFLINILSPILTGFK